MSLPIRCFTCGKPLKPWDEYERKLKTNSADKALDLMGMRRMCCRMRYKGHNPQINKDLLMYQSPRETRDARVFLRPE